MAQLRPKIVKLAKIIGGVTGITTRIDENAPEYYCMAGILTDEEADVAIAAGLRKERTAAYLANYIKEQTGAKVRGIELSLLQRCAAHCASKTDVDESYMSGKAAVENAVAGKTDYMPGFKCTRDENGYKCEIELLPLSEVANTEKKVPREWINEEGNGVTQEVVDYALPLINGENVGPKVSGLPRFANLKKIKAEA